MRNYPEFDDASIHRMLEFLPAFERGDYSSAHAAYLETGFDPANVNEFGSAVAQSGFILQFDWPSWTSSIGKTLDADGDFSNTGVEDLRKLLTSYVRANRLSGGALSRRCSDGRVVKALRRLRELTESVD